MAAARLSGDAGEMRAGRTYPRVVTERRPPGVSFESWIDRQIREAAERGEFANLPGAGKPIPGHGQPDDELWWVKDYIRREGLSGEVMLPASLRLRRQVERLPTTVRRLRSEQAVRDTVAELNARIQDWLRAPSGPQVHLAPVDADAVLARWRADRGKPGVGSQTAELDREPAGDAPGGPAHSAAGDMEAADRGPHGRARPWWRRLGRDRRATG